MPLFCAAQLIEDPWMLFEVCRGRPVCPGFLSSRKAVADPDSKEGLYGADSGTDGVLEEVVYLGRDERGSTLSVTAFCLNTLISTILLQSNR